MDMDGDTYSRPYYEGKQCRGALSPINRGLIRLMLQRCDDRSSILDIGCAKGTFLEALEPHFDELVGVDVSDYAIGESHKHLAKAKTYRCNMENEEDVARVFKHHRRFQVIVSLHTFEHLENPGAVLRTCHDLLTDDGHFFLVTPNPRSLATKVYSIFGRKHRCKVFADESHTCLLSKKEWEWLVSQAGFSCESKGTPFFVINNRFLDLIYPFHYSSFLSETGFELLFICRKESASE